MSPQTSEPDRDHAPQFAALAGCQHNAGEGGLSPYHREGADLVLQIGTAYFGCRDHAGGFDLRRLKDVVQSAPMRAVEIKLSQRGESGIKSAVGYLTFW